MILSLFLALLVTVSGAVATYLYDERASPAARLCTGACTGLGAFGLIGFILASLLGLGQLSIFLTALLTGAPFAILLDPERARIVSSDLSDTSFLVRRALAQPTSAQIGYAAFYFVV